MIKKVTFTEAKSILDSGYLPVLLDVRDDIEYITGHAVGSVLLPLAEITAESAEDAIPDKDSDIVVYCRTGRRSAEAAKALAALGYHNIYDVGSLAGWPYGTT